MSNALKDHFAESDGKLKRLPDGFLVECHRCWIDGRHPRVAARTIPRLRAAWDKHIQSLQHQRVEQALPQHIGRLRRIETEREELKARAALRGHDARRNGNAWLCVCGIQQECSTGALARDELVEHLQSVVAE